MCYSKVARLEEEVVHAAYGCKLLQTIKNKDLMKLFKKLCSQNQQRKFNVLWARLDELTMKQTTELAVTGDELIALGPLPIDTPQIVRRSGSAIRNFSQWIRNEPNEK